MAYTAQREELDPAFDGEWRALSPRAGMSKVFASPTWLRVWWEELGPGVTSSSSRCAARAYW